MTSRPGDGGRAREEAPTTGWPPFLDAVTQGDARGVVVHFSDCIGLLVFVAIPMVLAFSRIFQRGWVRRIQVRRPG